MTHFDDLHGHQPPAGPDPAPLVREGHRSTSAAALRRRRSLIGLATVLALVGGVLLGVALTDQKHPPRPSRTAQSAPLPPNGSVANGQGATSKPSTTHSPVTSPTVPASRRPALPPVQSAATLPSSQPVELTVPAIGVTTSIMNLGLNPDSTVQIPPLGRKSVAGWYQFSPTPGSAGASVILGHVDSAVYGAGVFYRLGALNPGDEVDVRRQDRTIAVFRVDRVAEYPKTQFPTALVYGQTSYSALRLVTCGGSFDSGTRNYRDNIIAFASLIATRHT